MADYLYFSMGQNGDIDNKWRVARGTPGPISFPLQLNIGDTVIVYIEVNGPSQRGQRATRYSIHTVSIVGSDSAEFDRSNGTQIEVGYGDSTILTDVGATGVGLIAGGGNNELSPTGSSTGGYSNISAGYYEDLETSNVTSSMIIQSVATFNPDRSDHNNTVSHVVELDIIANNQEGYISATQTDNRDPYIATEPEHITTKKYVDDRLKISTTEPTETGGFWFNPSNGELKVYTE